MAVARDLAAFSQFPAYEAGVTSQNGRHVSVLMIGITVVDSDKDKWREFALVRTKCVFIGLYVYVI